MPVSIGSGHRARLMGGAVLALTFVAGGLGGAALEKTVFANDGEALDDMTLEECRKPETPEQRRLRPWHSLSLTEEQKESILAVLDRRSAQAEDFWQNHRPEWDSTVERTRSDIRAILTAEQLSQWEQHRRERTVQDSLRREEYRLRCGETARLDDPRDGRGLP
jgi:hypothetical protein